MTEAESRKIENVPYWFMSYVETRDDDPQVRTISSRCWELGAAQNESPWEMIHRWNSESLRRTYILVSFQQFFDEPGKSWAESAYL